MKISNIFLFVSFALFSTLWFALDFAQAQPAQLSKDDLRLTVDLISTSATNNLSKIATNVGPNVVVNDPQSFFPNGLIGRSETTIASDPSGRFLLAGWNDADGFCGPPFNVPCSPTPFAIGLSGFGFSSDGGQTWTDGNAPFVFGTPGVVTRGDPWMDTGGPGQKTYYYANLAVTEDGSAAGMSVHRGKFTGKNFAFNNAVFIQPPNLGNDFLDKEALCAGHTSETKDQVVVSVTNFIEVQNIPQFGFGQIEAYISSDRASTFSGPGIVQADETSSVPLNEGIVNQGSACGIGPNGEIYVTWERGWLFPFFGGAQPPQIVFASSLDGGATFGARTLVSDISSGALFPPDGYNRGTHNDFPRICVATNDDDPFRGRIYVVYQSSEIANGGTQAQTGGFGHPDVDVYLRFSDDVGASWSAPTLVAGGGDGLLQFWPVVSCNQSDGTVDVTYNQSDESVPGSLVDVFYAGSSDGGVTFSAPLRVTDVSTNWGATATNIRPNFGDYIFHVSKSNRVMGTWADGRNGVPDVFYATVDGPSLAKEGEQLVASVPTDFILNQNYPNPFNPATNITFALPNESNVTFKVYDMLGREVAVLALGELAAGHHQIGFDAKDLSSGVYVYRLTADNFTDSKKMILLK